MTTKFNVGDWVYAVCGTGIIYAPIKSMEISEQVFDVEGFKPEFTEKYRRKHFITTYVFDMGENVIKIPEAIYNIKGSLDNREIKELLRLIFATQEELKKVYNYELK